MLSITGLESKAINKIVMIWDIRLGLGCFPFFVVGFVLDYELFLGMHPAMLDTLAHT